MLTSVAIVRPAPATAGATNAARRDGDQLPSFGRTALDDLLAVDDLGQEALAVDVAVLVEGHLHQDAGLLVGRDGHAVQRLGELLRSTLPIFSVTAFTT